MSDEHFDVAVIGAGIAGTSAAALLAEHGRVVLLEQEAVPAYHTTGRSAAVFAPCYGPVGIRALTRASKSFFLQPPDGFSDQALVNERLILLIARHDQLTVLEDTMISLATQSEVGKLEAVEVYAANSLLRPGYAAGGILDTQGLDINVAGLHQGYLKRFKKAGGCLRTHGRVTGMSYQKDRWKMSLTENSVSATLVVNAAGAWADEVAELAGVKPIGLIPKRRTAVMVEGPSHIDTKDMPITIDIEEQFYLKPEGQQLLISPADETPSVPCDAQPEAIDVAVCIDRISSAFSLDIQRPIRQWAGLRSFVSDGEPVVGFDSQVEGFFWLAGQGGYGIQTAPAMAKLCESMITGQALPVEMSQHGLNVSVLHPQRLREIVA